VIVSCTSYVLHASETNSNGEGVGDGDSTGDGNTGGEEGGNVKGGDTYVGDAGGEGNETDCSSKTSSKPCTLSSARPLCVQTVSADDKNTASESRTLTWISLARHARSAKRNGGELGGNGGDGDGTRGKGNRGGDGSAGGDIGGEGAGEEAGCVVLTSTKPSTSSCAEPSCEQTVSAYDI